MFKYITNSINMCCKSFSASYTVSLAYNNKNNFRYTSNSFSKSDDYEFKPTILRDSKWVCKLFKNIESKTGVSPFSHEKKIDFLLLWIILHFALSCIFWFPSLLCWSSLWSRIFHCTESNAFSKSTKDNGVPSLLIVTTRKRNKEYT